VASADVHSSEGDVASALLGLALSQKQLGQDLFRDLDAAVEALRNVPWTVLDGLRGDADILEKIDNAEGLLQRLRKTLSP
jgi:ParB family chromosome partitioning protein